MGSTEGSTEGSDGRTEGTREGIGAVGDSEGAFCLDEGDVVGKFGLNEGVNGFGEGDATGLFEGFNDDWTTPGSVRTKLGMILTAVKPDAIAANTVTDPDPAWGITRLAE